jgi:hypothetical protein
MDGHPARQRHSGCRLKVLAFSNIAANCAANLGDLGEICRILSETGKIALTVRSQGARS